MSKRTAKGKSNGHKITPLSPLTNAQSDLIAAIHEAITTVVFGPAGTGKTYVAACKAAEMVYDGEIDRIILSRPNVSAGRPLGFRPGSEEEKMADWVVPLMDAIKTHMGGGWWGENKKKIQVIPFETMRGRSFKDAFVILDEAQNTSPAEMKMFLTRIGEGSKVVVNGDIMQKDIRTGSGLEHMLGLIEKYDLPVPVIEFDINDIVRSGHCAMWIKAFEGVQPDLPEQAFPAFLKADAA